MSRWRSYSSGPAVCGDLLDRQCQDKSEFGEKLAYSGLGKIKQAANMAS